MKGTNCPNCGAPFHGGKCDYCGTEHPGTIRSSLESTPECVRIDCSKIDLFADSIPFRYDQKLIAMYRGSVV